MICTAYVIHVPLVKSQTLPVSLSCAESEALSNYMCDQTESKAHIHRNVPL